MRSFKLEIAHTLVGYTLSRQFPYLFFSMIDFLPYESSFFYKSVLKDKMPFVGTVRSVPFRLDYPVLPVINPIVKPYVMHLLKGKVDEKTGVISSKYALATKYPLAEYKSLERYVKPDVLPRKVPWRVAQHMLTECFRDLESSAVMKEEEALVHTTKSTSCGYPWGLVFSTKTQLIESDQFWSYYHSLINDVKKGRPRAIFWKSFIKGEFKKKTDLDNDVPRTITGCPLEMTVLGNQLFANMNGKITNENLTFNMPIWVGASKFRRGWHKLAMYLLQFPNLFHGDCHRWDGSVRKVHLQTIRDIRKTWLFLREEYGSLVDWYYAQVANSLIVTMTGDVVMKVGGQPSGQVNTLTDNTLLHILIWFYHWCIEGVRHGFQPTWSCFRQHVALMIMGDDVIYSCDDDVKHFMKPTAVDRTFNQIGFSLKHEGDVPQSIFDVEFCSMYFKKYDDVYVPYPRAEKAMMSIVAKPCNNVRKLLKRVLALRVEVFWDPTLLEMCDSIISGLLHDHIDELYKKPTYVDGDDQYLDDILQAHWSVRFLSDMYLVPPQ